MSKTLLAWRLRQVGIPIQVRAPRRDRDLRDEIGRLEYRRGTPTVVLAGTSIELEPNPALSEFLRRHPEGLCVCDLSSTEDGGARGDVVPFRPPRTGELSVSVPVELPAALTASLAGAAWRDGYDLARDATVKIDGGRYAILGLATLAALSEEDAQSITWWRSDGAALHLLREERHGRVSLRVVAALSPQDAGKAPCGPNTLVRLQPRAKLVLETEPSSPPAKAAAVTALCPPRSELFSAWAQYAAIDRREGEQRQVERGQNPIDFGSARQSGADWVAEAKLSTDAVAAWLGADAREGRKVRVGQPVAVRGTDAPAYELREATLRGPGQVDLLLRGKREAPPLPSHGTLEAREDYGAKTKRARERAAIDRLTAGAAACPTLLDVLLQPGRAEPPRLAPLPLPMEKNLDTHQERAVGMILGCQDLVAIQGPPGTGKTRVIVEALRQMGALRARQQEPLRVLISSVQNEAVHNVIDGLADVEGVLIRLVTRDAKNDEEALRFAEERRTSLQGILERLGRRAEGEDVPRRLSEARGLRSTVLALRRIACLPEQEAGMAKELVSLAANDDSLLGLTLRQDARDLARRLETLSAAPPPETAPASDPALPPVPEAADDLEDWWVLAGPTVPAERRADLATDVRMVREAAALPPSPKRDIRLKRQWPELRERLLLEAGAQPEPPRVAAAEPDSGEALQTEVGKWIARALVQLQTFEDGVARSRAGIVHGFREALADDPAAWMQILDRYGPTVAATCSMAAKATETDQELFDWVIIDEAGRASPFELLVPIVQGKRVVLIGDHRQLPPMVDQAIERQAQENAPLPADLSSETLFGSLHATLPSECRARLAIQYRMHGDIGSLVDELFYRGQGEGLSSWFEGERAHERSPRWGVLGNAPAAWVNVPRGRMASRYSNRQEQDVVLDLLEGFLQGGAKSDEIGVICPYQVQRGQLAERLLDRPDLADIAQVRTVDGVQGREWPAVVLCLTRDDGSPGFLASPNRINVAISRAQRQLIILGEHDVFRSSDHIRRTAPHLSKLANRLSRAGSRA